jgi:FkbM family methyltransferase
MPVDTFEAWRTQHDAARFGVVIAIDNSMYYLDVVELARQLPRQGFAWVSHHSFFCPRPIDFVTGPVISFDYASASEELDRLDALFEDEKSRCNLAEIIRARISLTCLHDWTRDDEYMPRDLPEWPDPLRFMDCGAYIGDTLANLGGEGYDFEAIATFEPDPHNFSQLVKNTSRDKNIVRFPCAVGAANESVRFVVTGTNGSHISTSHIVGALNESIQYMQSVALDDVLPRFAPNLIKMDIEGAEYNALVGAKQMIKRYRPGLAICLYHCPEHLWTIPFLLEDWKLGYRFYLRLHGFYTSIVLYALPPETR